MKGMIPDLGSMPQLCSGQGIFMKLLSGGRLAIAAALVMTGLTLTPARADVVVHIDKSSQRMSVSVNGAPRFTWPVSTGRSGYGTPSGVFHPQMMARRWFSRKYYNSPMPHSIFFYHGFAIHGTNDLGRLGGPASHGCVRLHPANAATLYALVERNGRGSTRIEIY
jgi:lipoprotein-anchoring transpeptidase ErfK/SrfK